jgi:hypothetical protein
VLVWLSGRLQSAPGITRTSRTVPGSEYPPDSGHRCDGFFDTIDRRQLLELLGRRVNDGGILRLIGKWLDAGVLEGEILTHPEHGTPQGGVISPLLANIFLHYVLDEWYEHEVKPRMKGRSFGVALLVESSQPYGRYPVGEVRKAAGYFSASCSPYRPQHLSL